MEVTLGEALRDFLNKSRLKSGVQAVQIKELWEKLMGKTISNYTDSIQISKQVLYISTSVAPLKNELIFQKETIKQRVNEALGEKAVIDVVIK